MQALVFVGLRAERDGERERTNYTSACEPVFEVFEKDGPRLDGIENEGETLLSLNLKEKAQHEDEGRNL